MPLAALDRISGKVTVETKGGKLHHGKLDPKALAHVRRYLRIRPETECSDLFTSGEGAALSYWGGRGIWRRFQKHSGVKRLGSHLIRHIYAQHMAQQGAPVADIQDVLGHESDRDGAALRWRGAQAPGGGDHVEAQPGVMSELLGTQSYLVPASRSYLL